MGGGRECWRGRRVDVCLVFLVGRGKDVEMRRDALRSEAKRYSVHQ